MLLPWACSTDRSTSLLADTAKVAGHCAGHACCCHKDMRWRWGRACCMVATMAAACSGSQKRGARPARAFRADDLTAADVVPRHSWCALHPGSEPLAHQASCTAATALGFRSSPRSKQHLHTEYCRGLAESLPGHRTAPGQQLGFEAGIVGMLLHSRQLLQHLILDLGVACMPCLPVRVIFLVYYLSPCTRKQARRTSCSWSTMKRPQP